MLARWARQDRPGYMVNMAHWLAQLRASFEKNRDDVTPTSAILAPVRTKRLVVLDDFGTEPPTEYTRRTLYEVLNYRYECRLPTIITSNGSVIDSVVRLGGDAIENNRLVSRISELAVVRELAGRNFREQLQPSLFAEMAR
jgi:DNA replication protein DnaC